MVEFPDPIPGRLVEGWGFPHLVVWWGGLGARTVVQVVGEIEAIEVEHAV